jgi:hypothetical protein
MLSTLRLSTATTRVTADMSVTNKSSNRTLIMNIIFMSVLAVLVLVAQPTLAGSGSGSGEGEGGSDGDGGLAIFSQSALIDEAINFIAEGKKASAFKSLKREIQQNPGNADAWYLLGVNTKTSGKPNDFLRGFLFDTINDDKTFGKKVEAWTSSTYVKWVEGQSAYDLTSVESVEEAISFENHSQAEMYLTYALHLKPKNKLALEAQARNHLIQEKNLLSANIKGREALISALDMALTLRKLCSFNCGYVDALFDEIETADSARSKFQDDGISLEITPR